MPFPPSNPAHAGPYRSARGANVGCLGVFVCALALALVVGAVLYVAVVRPGA